MKALSVVLLRHLRSCIRMPHYYYYAAFGIAVLLFLLLRKEQMRRRLAISLLTPYLFLVLGSTVFKRRTMGSYLYYLRPLRSYRIILANGFARSSFQITQVILNTLLLMPLGVLLPVALKRKWLAIPYGFFFSLMIEMTQLVLKKGYFEVDDLINNTLGVVIGYVVFCLAEWIGRKIAGRVEKL